jgi:YidC/Oxa1 family membrane protein insertase
MNQKIAELYQQNEVNPLAGCLPSLVQIPVFIGLYRSVLDLAKQNKLGESFLFLPSLQGPTYGADPAHGSDWILQGWYVFASLVFFGIPLLSLKYSTVGMLMANISPHFYPLNDTTGLLLALPLAGRTPLLFWPYLFYWWFLSLPPCSLCNHLIHLSNRTM